jgi:hypothetical protein
MEVQVLAHGGWTAPSSLTSPRLASFAGVGRRRSGERWDSGRMGSGRSYRSGVEVRVGVAGGGAVGGARAPPVPAAATARERMNIFSLGWRGSPRPIRPKSRPESKLRVANSGASREEGGWRRAHAGRAIALGAHEAG